MVTTVGRRRAEAARNDERVLESARAVCVADPAAPHGAMRAPGAEPLPVPPSGWEELAARWSP